MYTYIVLFMSPRSGCQRFEVASHVWARADTCVRPCLRAHTPCAL